MSDTNPAQSERRYRCSACRRDEGLTAIAYGYMEGTLSDDGRNLDDYSLGCESTDVCEDTITCPDHFDAPIEKLIDGVWHRWGRCDAEGCVAGRVWRGYRGYVDCDACKGLGGRDQPLGEAVAR